MSKTDANTKIGQIYDEKDVGKNSQERVADAMTAIVNAIPDPASGTKKSEIDYVAEKIWSEKNEEILESLSTHTTSIGIHFDKPAVINQHLDDYKTEGVYRIKGNARADNGLGTYEDAILIVSMIENAILQIRVTGARYQRRMFDSGAWKDWEDVIPEADRSTPGLMSIDHYKSVEDMITNFKGLVESQTEIKQALLGLQETMQRDENWDTSVMLTTFAQEEGFREWRMPIISFPGGENKETKVIYKDGTEFSIKGDETFHSLPIELKDIDNGFTAYNKNATTVSLMFSGGVNRTNILMVNSSKIIHVLGNYLYFRELDVSRCPNLTVLGSNGHQAKSIDLRCNPKLVEISLGESDLEKLDLRGCLSIQYLRLNHILPLRLSGIEFPTVFRPQTMFINGGGFTYEDVVALADKYSEAENEQTVNLWIDKAIYLQLVNTGDEVYFGDKYISLLYNN